MELGIRQYFIITGSELIKLADAYADRMQGVHNDRVKFLAELGTDEYFGDNWSITAVQWDRNAEIPNGWRRTKSNVHYISPNRRLKAGKEAEGQLRRLRYPDPSGICQWLALPHTNLVKSYLIDTEVYRYGSQYVIVCAKPPIPFQHEDLTEMPEWEFIKLNGECQFSKLYRTAS